MIRDFIFDMGGVLVDLDINASIEAFRKLGYPEPEKLLDPYLQRGVTLELEQGKITAEEFCGWIRERCIRHIGEPGNVSDQSIHEAFNRFIAGFATWKLDLLLDLRRKGYRTWMLSNTNSIVFPHIRDTYFLPYGHSMEEYFDGLFLSYEMGLVKPYEPIFREMIDRTGLDVSHSLFIDDSEKNAATARALGIGTFVPRPGEDFRYVFEPYV